MKTHQIELLAPAGDIESFYLAIKHGADAVYLAGKAFGARSSAQNFTIEEIQECVEYAHIFDKKVYVTINTLLFDDEFIVLKSYVKRLSQIGVDAVIVQDFGVLEFLSKCFVGLEIHASTQMNVHTVAQAQVLKDMGVSRIVLAREVDISLAKEIQERVGIEVEVFAHGALCVSYSGNCLMSSFIGKRSGNRGKCAQPCRLPYRLTSQTETKHHISTKDLMTLEELETILRNNVVSLKIEGRLKRKEYVAQVTKSYRKMLDAVIQHHPIDLDEEKTQLQKIFNREFTKGYLLHAEDEDITNTSSVNHIGVLVGEIVTKNKNYIEILLHKPLRVQDGIRIVGTQEVGFVINELYIGSKSVQMANFGERVRLHGYFEVAVKDKVLLTTDAEQLKGLENATLPKVPLSGWAYLEEEYLVLEVFDGTSRIKERSVEPVQIPQKQGTSIKRIEEQLLKTGDTHYFFDFLELNITKDIFIPISQINSLRTSALFRLTQEKIRVKDIPFIEYSFVKPNNSSKIPYGLVAKVHTKEQLDACLSYPYSAIYVVGENLYQDSLAYNQNMRILFYPGRIHPKTQENRKEVLSNFGNVLKKTHEVSCVYLNTTNAYAAYFLRKQGVQAVGLSVEMSKEQIKTLLKNYRQQYNEKLDCEVMVYGHHEMMIMRHDFLKKEQQPQTTKLIDRKEFQYEVRKDDSGSTIIYNPMRLVLLDELLGLQELGVNRFLLDFTIEDEAEVHSISQKYMDLYNKKQIAKEKIENMTYGHYKDGVL